MTQFTLNGVPTSASGDHEHLLAALRDELGVLSPKDLILHLIGMPYFREEHWRESPTDTCIIEFGGPALSQWNVDELSVLTNMTVEGGLMTGVVEPCQPIVDFLTTPIPVISDLAGEITFLDIASLFGNVDPRFIEVISDIIELVNSIPAEADELLINFGDFVTVLVESGDVSAGGSGSVFVGQGPAFDDAGELNPSASGVLLSNASFKKDGDNFAAIGTIQIVNLPAIEIPLPVVACQHVQYLLGTTDSECRYQDVAFAVFRVLHNAFDFSQRLFSGAVQTVTIGALHDDQVSLANHGRILQYRHTGSAQIAAEHQLACLCAILEPEFHNGRSEDMSGLVQTQGRIVEDFHFLAVDQTVELRQCSFRVFNRV